MLAGVSFAGSRFGVYRSADGGVTWAQVLQGNLRNKILFDPANGSIAYAATGGYSGDITNRIAVNSYRLIGAVQDGVYKSTDAGVTWKLLSGIGVNALPVTNLGNIEIAISQSDPRVLYAGIASTVDGTLLGLFRTSDGGATWIRLANTPDYCRYLCDDRHTIRVHPTNPNVVFAGGRVKGNILFRTLDGGSSWTEVSLSSDGLEIHPDMKALAFSPIGDLLYAANDGGVYSTANPTEPSVLWSNLNATFGATHFFPGQSIHPTNINVGYGGPGEGGTARYLGYLSWTNAICGDGGPTAIDPETPNIVYADCIGPPTIYRSTSSGVYGTWKLSNFGIDASDRALGIRPLVIDPSNPRTLYFGTYRVYRTTDGAATWTTVSGDITKAVIVIRPPNRETIGYISALAVAPSDPNTVYAGTSDGKVQVTSSAGAGSAAIWNDRSVGVPDRFVTKIVLDADDAGTAYISLSGFSGFLGDTAGHVFKTIDHAVHWTDISGNLPNIPVNDIVVDPDLPKVMYVATDIGVLATADGGVTWGAIGTGLPNVAVTGLNLHRPTRTLRAGTYGRGMWDLQIPLTGQLLPGFNVGGVVNSASFTSPVAPGSIATVFGANLAQSSSLANAVPLPTSLGGVTPLMGSIIDERAWSVPLFFAGGGQLNIQVPWELEGQAQAMLSPTIAGITYRAVIVNIAPYAPGIYTMDGTGRGQGAVVNVTNGQIAAPGGSIAGSRTSAAAKGDFLTIYCTGLGGVTIRPTSGGAAPLSPLSHTKATVTASIDGVATPVSFAGLTPGAIGLYQVNVQVPAGVPSGDAVPLVISVGGIISNVVTIAIR